MRFISVFLSLCLWTAAWAFDYSLNDKADMYYRLIDNSSGIPDISTIFVDQLVLVSVHNIQWIYTGDYPNSNNLIFWNTYVDGQLQDSGTYSVANVNRTLPSEIDVGSIIISTVGSHMLTVTLQIDNSSAIANHSYQAYYPEFAMIPLFLVLFLAVSTHMVEFSLFVSILVGAIMVTGNLVDGFRAALDTYILNALVDRNHGYIYLNTLFVSGLVAMFEKSGGMFGFTKKIARIAKTARAGQMATFIIGFSIFFDDYANVLLVGQTMRPLANLLFISREKLSFIVDSVSAPVASSIPISSWVGFEVSLIQYEVDKIVARANGAPISIDSSGFAIMLSSFKYRYYPLFLLVLVFTLIVSQRDMGTMLIAERKTQVYERTDGGDGRIGRLHEDPDSDDNMPRKGTPYHAWNLTLPVIMLVSMIFSLFVKTGEIEGADQTVMEKLQNADSYKALMWGTMSTILVTMLFYASQPVKDGYLAFPGKDVVKDLISLKKGWDGDGEDPRARVLVNIPDSIAALILGMTRVFTALIVLVLAWASGEVMAAVGADRYFSGWVSENVYPEALPTLSFLLAFCMALATGTSWATMSILFPLALVPAYDASEGDAIIFYAVTAGIISGAVAGDQMSPISGATILCAKSCDCQLLAHVGTQAPYGILVIFFSTMFGTIPVGYHVWPNFVSLVGGFLALIIFTYTYCVKVLSPTGRYDWGTELWIKFSRRKKKVRGLLQLRRDCIRKTTGGTPTAWKESHMDFGDSLEINPTRLDNNTTNETDIYLQEGDQIPEALSPQISDCCERSL